MRTEADAAYAARDWALAAARLRALADLNPQDAGLRFRLGNALVRAGRLEEAIAAYSDSLRLEPAQPKAQHNRGVAHLRLASASLGQAAALTSEPDIAERAAAMVRAVDALLEPDAP